MKIPYILVVGEKEEDSGTVNVRDRKGEEKEIALAEFVKKIESEIKEKTLFQICRSQKSSPLSAQPRAEKPRSASRSLKNSAAKSSPLIRGRYIAAWISEPQSRQRRSGALFPIILLTSANPDEDYTVADYQRDAVAAIRGIIARGALPILVGGTGLYMRAVLENLDIPKTVADPELRARIEKDIADVGLEAVFRTLVARDPEAAYVVDPKNPRRVVRALEVAISTGEPFTAQRMKRTPLFDALVFGLNPPPEILRERIDQRVDEMMRDELVDEVATLIKKYGQTPAAFDAIGYREVISYLNRVHRSRTL